MTTNCNTRSPIHVSTQRSIYQQKKHDGIRRKIIVEPITTAIIMGTLEGIVGGHFSTNITLHKVLTTFNWWPTMTKNVYLYWAQCDICRRVGPKVSTSLQPLHPTMHTKVFQKRGLHFNGPLNLSAKNPKKSVYYYNHELHHKVGRSYNFERQHSKINNQFFLRDNYKFWLPIGICERARRSFHK